MFLIQYYPTYGTQPSVPKLFFFTSPVDLRRQLLDTANTTLPFQYIHLLSIWAAGFTNWSQFMAESDD